MPEPAPTGLSRAIQLANSGKLEAAKNILLSLAASDPKSKKVLLVLGRVHFEMGSWSDAVKIFVEAVEVAPKLEAASLGLFHSLWELERYGEAIEELKRFQILTNFSSTDYLEIIREMKQKS